MEDYDVALAEESGQLPEDAHDADTPSALMGLFRRLVPGARTTRQDGPDPHDVLRRFLQQSPRTDRGWFDGNYGETSIDPARDAAMNRIRRMRIHAA